MTVLNEIKEATIAGSMDNTVAGIEQALSEDRSPGDIIQNAAEVVDRIKATL